jgi:hypothetical protein
MSALAEFHDLLLPELPGCTVAMVNLHLREAAREFCAKTSAWRQALTAVDTVAGQAGYVLATPAESELVRVTELTVNDILLWRHSAIERAATDSEDLPKYDIDETPFTLDANLTTITLAADEIPTAAVTGGLAVTAALKPTAAAANLPDFLLVHHSEAIRHGTLQRLMRMAKKPWTDRPLAVDYESRWHSALNFAAYQAQVGYTRRPLRVTKHG